MEYVYNNNNNNNRLFMAPHLVRAQSDYKNIRIHSFHYTHTHPHTHTHTHTQARTHAHARTHARTHTHTHIERPVVGSLAPERLFQCSGLGICASLNVLNCTQCRKEKTKVLLESRFEPATSPSRDRSLHHCTQPHHLPAYDSRSGLPDTRIPAN